MRVHSHRKTDDVTRGSYDVHMRTLSTPTFGSTPALAVGRRLIIANIETAGETMIEREPNIFGV